MVFGTWFCPDCQKSLTVGTVAPRSVMYRHLATARHLKNKAARTAEEQRRTNTKKGINMKCKYPEIREALLGMIDLATAGDDAAYSMIVEDDGSVIFRIHYSGAAAEALKAVGTTFPRNQP